MGHQFGRFAKTGLCETSIILDYYGHLLPSTQAEAAEMLDEPIMSIQLDTTAHESNSISLDRPTCQPPYLAHINQKPLYLGAFVWAE